MAENGYSDAPTPFRKFRAFIGTLESRIGASFEGQGRPDEPLSSRVSRWMQQFGFSSVPPNGTQVACVETEAGVCAVASDYSEGEPPLATGWSAQYDTAGNVVKLMTDDGIAITATDGALVISSVTDDVSVVAEGAVDINAATDDVSVTADGTNNVIVKSNGAGEARIGSGTMKGITRSGDNVNATISMAAWITAVSLATGVAAPLGAMGTTSTGSTSAKAGD